MVCAIGAVNGHRGKSNLKASKNVSLSYLRAIRRFYHNNKLVSASSTVQVLNSISNFRSMDILRFATTVLCGVSQCCFPECNCFKIGGFPSYYIFQRKKYAVTIVQTLGLAGLRCMLGANLLYGYYISNSS